MWFAHLLLVQNNLETKRNKHFWVKKSTVSSTFMIKVSRFQGFKVSRFQGFKVSRFQGYHCKSGIAILRLQSIQTTFEGVSSIENFCKGEVVGFNWVWENHHWRPSFIGDPLSLETLFHWRPPSRFNWALSFWSENSFFF